jgi:hypothetical protein
MKTKIFAPLALLVLAGIAAPAHAEVDNSIRPMRSAMRTAVEMIQNRTQKEHALNSARMRADNPNLSDGPLFNRPNASTLKPVTRGMQSPATRHTHAHKQQLALAGSNAAAAVKTMRDEPAAKPKDIVIDAIVAYTTKAASNYLDIERELVDLAIEEANRSFRLSNLGRIKLRLVHAYRTDYVEEGEHFDHVWRFADKGDGYMEEIHGLRDHHRADVAILVVDDAKGCGLATRVLADADEAFAVVHHACAAASYTVAHEIGHLIGARHELSYVNGTKWRDIMGYKESCGGCPRLPVWSSPTVLVNGEPAGTAEFDNARVIAKQAARVAAFR